MRGGLKIALAAAAALGAHPAAARERHVEISPYIGVDQTVLAGIKGQDDVLTYTGVTVGVAASVETRNVRGQADVRYEHQFGWGSDAQDQDVVSGIGQVAVQVVPDTLSLEAGALGTRIRTDGVNGANGNLVGAGDATSQVYSAYVGPTLSAEVGALDVSASYRLGYTRLDDDATVVLPNGQQVLSGGGDSVTHSAVVSAGVKPGVLPVGVTASAGYDREDADQLDQRYEDKWVRGDVTVPVSPTVALIGGVGYEDIRISQRDVERDGNGNPLIVDGRYVTDENSPRMLVYDQEGLIWDAGVMWRPSRRTTLEARVGRRYGGTHYEGSFVWQRSRDSSFALVVFDSIDSFGRVINSDLTSLSGDFSITRNPFSGDLTGCAFSPTGGGQCFSDALTGVTVANFRHRGVAMQYTQTVGAWNWGVAYGYAQRKFIAPSNSVFTINGSKDEIYYGTLMAGRRLDARSGIDASVYANYFDGGVDVLNVGAYASYYRNVSRRLTATASVGVDGVDTSALESVITALGQVGLRYQF